MPNRGIGEVSIGQAVEITKVAIAGQNAPFANHGDIVAKFLEIVANKLQELRDLREQQRQ
jgi:hypothetical protein